MSLFQRGFGRTGLKVSVLGLGAGQLGDASLSEEAAGRLLNGALDLGITLIDTARGYGLSEARIGRHLAHRRAEFLISTKVGYGIPGYADWSHDGILAGVDEALRLMQTDYLDIVHLHSCPLGTLEWGEVITALERAREMGKVRVVAYSGDNSELRWAVNSGRFAGVECSINLFDQRALDFSVPQALDAGIGVIAKRALGNAPWRFLQFPEGHYCAEYWQRWQGMGLDPRDLPWQELALRFATYAPGVSCAIVGTTSLEHLQQNVAEVARGPLAPAMVDAIRAAFQQHDHGWASQV